MNNNGLYSKSIIFGTWLGAIFGIAIGAATGALSGSWSGVEFGAIAGVFLGVLTGATTATVTVRVGGDSGGVSTGAYAGMLYGAVLGGFLGAFIPNSFRAGVAAFHVLVLDVLTQGRFETAVLLCFLLSIIGTGVGAWVGGRTLKPRDLSKGSSRNIP